MKTFWHALLTLNFLTPPFLMAAKPLVPRESLERPVDYAQVGDDDPLIDGVLDEESYEQPPTDPSPSPTPMTITEPEAESVNEPSAESSAKPVVKPMDEAPPVPETSTPPATSVKDLQEEAQTPQNAPDKALMPATINRSATMQGNTNTQCQQLEQQRLRYEQLSQRHEESMIQLGKLLEPVVEGVSMTPAQERKREQAKVLFERLTRNQEQLKVKMGQTVEMRAKQGCQVP